MPRSVHALLLLAHAASALAASAEGAPDRRIFSRVVHRAAVPREVSVYAELPPPSGQEPLRLPLWSGLAIRLPPLAHQDAKAGIFAYSLQLLSEERDGQPIPPIDQPAHGITADVIAAFHFRNRDNSGPNAPGPLNVNAPGELRIVRYPGVTLEIRVLSFEIVDARPGAVPGFSSLRLLVTAREASTAQP